MKDPERPDPDALLLRVKADEARGARAQLKIFFGFAPGVGKTYAMLESARGLKKEGVDVVVGCVETHGRKETAQLLEGLEIIPRKIVEYRGARLEELDLAAVHARHPRVVLLDELAHTNAPGSRHKKRWQDVEELLEAGIGVKTTLNVQHIESLNDVIAQVTGVRVRETVPDSILARADEIELVDLPPDELLARLKEGKVYLAEQAERAAESFFRRGNLLALRELALRRVAERVDADVQAYRAEHAIVDTWAAAERILVCVGPAPGSARLVRATYRFAAGLRAPWVAAYVDGAGLAPLSEADRDRLEAHLRLAESLGGEVVQLRGTSISEALLDYARKRNVTRIVIGKPTHPRLRDLVRGSLLDELVRGSGQIDVQVISGDVDEKPRPLPEPPPSSGSVTSYGYSALVVAVATGLSAFAKGFLELPDIVMLYLLGIVLVALRFGRAPSIFAAAISVAAYDFFFVPPFFTFAVGDVRHVMTFFMMFAIGYLVSELMLRLRRQERAARSREAGATALLRLARVLGTSDDESAAVRSASQIIAEVGAAKAAILSMSQDARLEVLAESRPIDLGPPELAVAQWVLEHGRPAGWGTDTLPGSRVVCFPMSLGSEILGVLVLAPNDPQDQLDAEQRHLIDALLRQTAVALERSRLAGTARIAILKARTEELRSSLLSTVSHDLRTPLAVITGAASTLLEPSRTSTPAQRQELLSTIAEEAERLERLVANLLDMTRVESGGLTVKREWVPMDELIGAALTRLEKSLQARAIETRLGPDLPMIAVDPVLFEQVLLNLIENAAKYSGADRPIEIEARIGADKAIEIEVRDRGPGIPTGTESKLFEKFYRGAHAQIAGSGLGLAIARGIVEAHGGTIVAENRAGGGAIFRVSLPSSGDAPSVPSEASLRAGPA